MTAASVEGEWPIAVPDPEPPVDVRGGLGRWFVIFFVNLPVCISFGYNSTTGSGRLGMGVGLLILFAAGWESSRRWRSLGVDIVLGGAFVALSQLLPIAQFVAGGIGLTAAGWLDPAVKLPQLPDFAVRFSPALVATMITGVLLMAGALALGFASRLVTPRHWRYGPETYEIKSKRLAPDDLRDFP